MSLTENELRAASDDSAMHALLSRELQLRLPEGEGYDLDAFVRQLRELPVGLRAMAAIYQLDVSITLDDLGWHFGNWHHRGYCQETLQGLRELEIAEAAEIFSQAYAIVQPYWDWIGELLRVDFTAFTKWYSESELEKKLDPLTRRMWELYLWEGEDGNKPKGLLDYWVTYARKYPERCTGSSLRVVSS